MKHSYDARWEEAITKLLKKHIKSMEVTCPSCKKKGLLFSKWIKGPQKKLLYVCHSNGGSHPRLCFVDNASSSAIRAYTQLVRDDVLKLIRMGKPIVLFSGGQDSLCLLDYLNRLAKSVQRQITAVHAETTAGFPEVEAYVKEVCDQMDIRLEIVRPSHDYFDLAKRWGIPGVKSRWCCKTLKVAPIRRYLARVDGDVVVFDGIRAAESNMRATYLPLWYHPTFRCISASPLFRWSDEKIRHYIKANDLPISPAANLNTSAECWCGAYKARADFKALLEIHPEIFNQLVEVEKAQKGKYTFLYEKGERIPLCSLKTTSEDLNKSVGKHPEPQEGG